MITKCGQQNHLAILIYLKQYYHVTLVFFNQKNATKNWAPSKVLLKHLKRATKFLLHRGKLHEKHFLLNSNSGTRKLILKHDSSF